MTTYGRVNITTIQRTKNKLRRLIQSEGTPAIQEEWDRLEQWIDSPPMMPRPLTPDDWIGFSAADLIEIKAQYEVSK